jgi:hypothetical protein
MNYIKLKEEHAPCIDCFFAFSQGQMEKGIKEHNLEGKKIYSAGYGLYGTDEGIKNYLGFYGERSKRIAEQCEPQEVYNYEFDNHECSYTNDDSEAIGIVIGYFGAERAKEVKRRYAYKSILELAS